MSGLTKQEPRTGDTKRRVIISQGQSPGDVLMFTRALGDLKLTYPDWEIDVRTPCPEIFENSPRLTPISDNDENVEHVIAAYEGIHKCGWCGQHFSDAFREDLEKSLNVPITKTSLRPEIWLSDEENGWINQVEVEFGYRGKFWLIDAGHKEDAPLKQYPYYQEVMDILRVRCPLKFVQIGHADHIHAPLDGSNVLSLVGKTDLRQLIRLAWWAEGIISPISFPMVMAAAYEAPCVVVAAATEPIRWQVYPNHRWLTMVGSMSCAAWDGCWKSKVEDCAQMVDGYPKCYRMIEPEAVADAVLSYYEGGSLNWGPRK